MVKIKPMNRHDILIYRDAKIVGHVPYDLAPRMSEFFIKEFAEMTGAKVNMGAGYGLEVPCVYRLYGPNVYVDKIKALVESLLADGHCNLSISDFSQCF